MKIDQVIKEVRELQEDLIDVDGLSEIHRLCILTDGDDWTVKFLGETLLSSEDYDEELSLKNQITEELHGMYRYLSLTLELNPKFKKEEPGDIKDTPKCIDVLYEVGTERARQDEKWGGPEHDADHTTKEFIELIENYAGWAKVMDGMNSPDKARKRLIQVAALAVATVENMDRKMGKG